MAMEAWRICAGWLIECGALPHDHKTTYPNAAVFDLAQTLRDGVVLCQLLNHLRPGAIDLVRDVSLRPQMSQFLCIKNIRSFLHACSSDFGLRSQDLFDPSGLFDVTDFGQVIFTISRLSQSPLALQTGIPAFEVDCQIENQDEEDIYKNLEDLADEHDLADEGDNYDTVEGEEDAIYDDLVSLRKQANRSVSQAPAPEKKGKRQFCIEEIVETEKKYVDALYMLINGFKKPLSGNIPARSVKAIFLNLQELHECHCTFNADLSSTQCTRPSPQRAKPQLTISQVFLNHKDIFFKYGFYCSSLMAAQEAVDEILKDSTARQKIEDCELRANQNKFRLRELLSVPMQRCMKYHLLLRELIKHTEKTHPEKQELEKALEVIQDICLYVNDVKRDTEHMQNSKDIEKSMINYRGNHISSYGRPKNDGELKLKFAKKGATSSNQRHCFLFDKVIIVCNKSGKGQESYEYNTIIELEKYKIEDNLPKGRSGKWNWCFWLTPVNNNNSEDVSAVEVYCKTQDMMLKWLEHIRLAQGNINPAPNSPHKYEYTSFPEPTYCIVCKKLLRGLFFQGYKCSGCSIDVHKDCITSDSIQQCAAVRRTSRQHHGKQGIRATQSYQGSPRPPGGFKALTFEKDDPIEVLERDNATWWKGRNPRTLDTGLFPAGYVAPQRQSTTSSHVRSCYEHSTPGNLHNPHNMRSPSPNNKGLLDSRWYVGNLDRQRAIEKLKDKPDSCYLVRDSLKDDFQTHAISIKHENIVKHIKVLFYLGKYGLVDKDSCDFETLPDLIKYYSQNSLRDVFNGLHSTLKIPLRDAESSQVSNRNGPSMEMSNSVSQGNPHHRVSQVQQQQQQVAAVAAAAAAPSPPPADAGNSHKARRYTVVGRATALFNFNAREAGELSLHEGDAIEIISKAGEIRGWWKGANHGRIGYFPFSYVEEIE